MKRWKHSLLAVPLLFALAAGLLVSRAEDAPKAAGDGNVGFQEVTPESAAAAAKGLAWLAEKQEPHSGAWSTTTYPVATTSLATLALMADGNLPGRGKYGENVRKGIDYILRRAGELRSGFITEPIQMQSRMHGHGFATLLLAEAYGMIQISDDHEKERFENAIRSAVSCISAAQTRDGGWGYGPEPNEGDEASITICCVQALRSARNAGFRVDKKVVEKGIEYIKKCKNHDGSYRYSLARHATNSSFALTAGAVASLAFFGQTDCEEYKQGIEYMLKSKAAREPDGRNFYYENFYAVLAMYYAGDQYWKDWYPGIRDEMVKIQEKGDGRWQGELSPEYCTAFACLMLEVPYRYLPIYQR